MAKADNQNEAPTGAGRCPICGKPSVPALRPFCSPRCADVDLHSWLTGRYAVPAAEEEPGEFEDGDDGR